jgi:hypothetical protein
MIDKVIKIDGADLITRAPYGVLVTVNEAGDGYVLAEPGTEGAGLVYGTPWRGTIRTVKAIIEVPEGATVHAVPPADMLAGAATVRQFVQHVSVCDHDHDYGFAVEANPSVDRPVGVTWAYGWMRNPGMGRDCPVCTPKVTRNACQGNTKEPHGYSALRATTKATCGERHAAWGDTQKAIAKANSDAKKEAARADAQRVADAAAAGTKKAPAKKAG